MKNDDYPNVSQMPICLGQTIKALRLTKGITQKEFAKKTEMSQGFLSLIEKGERSISIDLFRKMAVAFDLSMIVLLYLALKREKKLREFTSQEEAEFEVFEKFSIPLLKEKLNLDELLFI